jgi:hypothetical protein
MSTYMSLPDIYAASDMASFDYTAMDKSLRVEREDSANTMGSLAGRAMPGDAATYNHLPCFYSELFEPGRETVGQSIRACPATDRRAGTVQGRGRQATATHITFLQ